MSCEQHDEDGNVGGLQLDRRGFLTGVSLALGALPLQALATSGAQVMPKRRPAAQPRRAIHQDLAYFDLDGAGEVYDAPRGNQATRDYVASLTQEEFLRRHWFT